MSCSAPLQTNLGGSENENWNSVTDRYQFIFNPPSGSNPNVGYSVDVARLLSGFAALGVLTVLGLLCLRQDARSQATNRSKKGQPEFEASPTASDQKLIPDSRPATKVLAREVSIDRLVKLGLLAAVAILMLSMLLGEMTSNVELRVLALVAMTGSFYLLLLAGGVGIWRIGERKGTRVGPLLKLLGAVLALFSIVGLLGVFSRSVSSRSETARVPGDEVLTEPNPFDGLFPQNED